MKPYYDSGGITIYHGDCRDYLASVEPGSIVCTDPPYGIGWVPRVNHTGSDHVWHDNEGFDPRPWLAVGAHHLFWGAQYIANLLPVSDGWFVWVKRPVAGSDFSKDARTYATCELAWSDFGRKPRFKSLVWDGGKRAGDKQNREFCHPSQKPLEVMRWCLDSAPDGLIVDPFMGSGTTLRAALDMGRMAIGIELEERYCEIAAKRMSQGVLQF